MKFDTKTVHGGQEPEKTSGAISTPIFQTATYVMDELDEDKGYDYARSGTPTRVALEKNLTELEGGNGTICFSSGLSAIDVIMHTLEKGDHVLCCDDLYGGTTRMFSDILSRSGIDFDFIEMSDPSVVNDYIREETGYVFIETPTNPMLKLVDIEGVAKVTKDRDVPLIVDNTFMTPCFQKPFDLGADIIVHSLTKYLAGHNDVLGGAVVSNSEEFQEQMSYMVTAIGSTLGPMDSWLSLRGIKTLALRMEKHNSNAIKIAKFLKSHKKVDRVIYPGLPEHPQHKLADKQMSGYGGMITFQIKGGISEAKSFMKDVEVWLLAESLGGVESLVTHPVTMTHGDVPEEKREELGITDGLIRLSVGIENPNDLREDLDRAL